MNAWCFALPVYDAHWKRRPKQAVSNSGNNNNNNNPNNSSDQNNNPNNKSGTKQQRSGRHGDDAVMHIASSTALTRPQPPATYLQHIDHDMA
jgi:hypothetical protein